MPQAIGAAIAALIPSLAGVTVAGVAITTVIGYGILIGGSLLISSILRPKPRDPNRGSDAQAVINQAVGPRVWVYGRAKVGGTRAFFDSKNGHLYQIVMLAAREIDAIESYWVGDKQVTVDPSDGAVLTSPWNKDTSRSKIFITPRYGTVGQAVAPRINDAFTQWTDQHRLKGIAYIEVMFVNTAAEDFQAKFPQSHNTPVTCVIRGAKVYDPRDPYQELEEDWNDPVTWEWSDNPALCVLDYLRHPDGMKKPSGRIDFASFSNFAWLCDENVPLAAGGTEKRYRLGGNLTLTEDPVDVLARMLATCDGELFQTSEGKIAIRGGKWDAPTVTIQDKDILAIGEIAEGNDAFSAFNELRVMYTSPLHDYQPQEAEPWRDAAAQLEHGAIVEDFVLDMVQSPSQGRRLAKIYMHKQNAELRGSIVTKLSGLNALGERVIDGVIPELFVSDSFMVTGFSLRPDLSGCEIGISSITAAAYEWDPATEEGQNPPPPQDTSPDPELPLPQDLVLTIDAGNHVIVEVDDPDRDDLALEAQIKAGAGGTYANMTVSGFEAVATSTVSSGVTYYVRARWNRDGFVGDWSAEASITAP